MNFLQNTPRRRSRRTAASRIRAMSLAVCLTLLLAFLLSACANPQEPKPDAHETFFQVLNAENQYASELGLAPLSAFYDVGASDELFQKLASAPSTTTMNLSAKVADALFPPEATGFVLKLLQDLTLSFSSKSDPAKMNNQTNVAVMLSGRKLASADLLVESGERFGVRSEEFYPQYVAVEYEELLNIIANMTGSDEMFQLSKENFQQLGEKYLSLINLMNLSPEQVKETTKPFVDKAKEVVVKEKVTLEEGAAVEGVPDKTYTKLSLSLSADEFKQLLTALTQTAKENTALMALIKEKYTIFYDYMSALAELGGDGGALLGTMPLPENLESLIQSTLTGLETYIGSTAMPFGDFTAALYLDGKAMKCFNVTVQISDESLGMSAVSLWFKAYADADGTQNGLLVFAFNGEGGAENTATLTSVLKESQDGGSHALKLNFEGPDFVGGAAAFALDYSRTGKEESLKLESGMPDASGGTTTPIVGFQGTLKDAGDGNNYAYTASIGANDPTGGIETTAGAYTVDLMLDGTVSFGDVTIPAFADEDALFLTQDNFYDGTFDAIASTVNDNISRFIQANMQLLGQYGVPGF
jgi:hypothetical protein